jgi:hypothetical protein
MRILSLHFRAAACSFVVVAVGAIALRAAGARGVDFRSMATDAGGVAIAVLALFGAFAALFVVSGGARTLDRLLAWGAATTDGRAAARVVAGGVALVVGAGVGLLASAHFLTHYRAGGWAALANGAVVGAGLLTAAAAFVPAERIAARLIGARRPAFSKVVATAGIAVALALAVVGERVFPGSIAITASAISIEAAVIRFAPRLPHALEFVVTRAFIVGCLIFVYMKVFGVPMEGEGG